MNGNTVEFLALLRDEYRAKATAKENEALDAANEARIWRDRAAAVQRAIDGEKVERAGRNETTVLSI